MGELSRQKSGMAQRCFVVLFLASHARIPSTMQPITLTPCCMQELFRDIKYCYLGTNSTLEEAFGHQGTTSCVIVRHVCGGMWCCAVACDSM